jgi:hypothetical protein
LTQISKIRYKEGFGRPNLLGPVSVDTPADPAFVPLEARSPIEQARFFARKGMAHPEKTTGEFNRKLPKRTSPWRVN